jgi:hypothetical protein
MAAQDPRSEQIRALIEEVDRVRSESEGVINQADRARKSSFWPDRRRSLRIPSSPDRSDGSDSNEAA